MRGVVQQYNTLWPKYFDEIRSHLEFGLTTNVLGIEHVGSTSIPGMVAKPIIDLDIIIGPGNFDKIRSDLINLDYLHQGDKGLKGRESFKYLGSEPLHNHHLYVIEVGNIHLKKHLTFREFLRLRPELVEEISNYKLNLASQVHGDRKKYQYLKENSDFIQNIVDQAFSNPSFSSKYFI